MLLFASTAASEPSSKPTSSNSTSQKSRLSRGALWGALATIAMSIPMAGGMATGVAPMPEPIPKALVGLVVSGLAPLAWGLAVLSHLAYGSFWGAALTQMTPRVTLWTGLALGTALWLLMQVVALPLIGWGPFGAAITPAIAGATLALHLIYGGVLGWGLGR